LQFRSTTYAGGPVEAALTGGAAWGAARGVFASSLTT